MIELPEWDNINIPGGAELSIKNTAPIEIPYDNNLGACYKYCNGWNDSSYYWEKYVQQLHAKIKELEALK